MGYVSIFVVSVKKSVRWDNYRRPSLLLLTRIVDPKPRAPRQTHFTIGGTKKTV